MNNVLVHHGIKGQKWGVRNGPPYPLTPGKHSNAEKKVDSIRSQGDLPKNLNKVGAAEIVAAYATVAVISLSVKAIQKGQQAVAKKMTNNKISEINNAKTSPIDEVTGFHRRTDSNSIDEDLKNVNPLWDDGKTAAVSQNCVYCSAVVEMRRRGYDVTAKSTPVPTHGLHIISSIFPGGKAKALDPLGLIDRDILDRKTDEKQSKDADVRKGIEAKMRAASGANTEFAHYVINSMSKEPDSRGSIFVTWGVGGGHALAYEVKNGHFMVYDGQCGKVFKGDDLTKLLSMTYLATYYRTDNLDFDLNKAKEVMV